MEKLLELLSQWMEEGEQQARNESPTNNMKVKHSHDKHRTSST